MRHMLLREWVTKFSRRGFLRGSAATIAAVAVTGKDLLANAAEAAGLSADESRTLLKFTRDLFPHDRLDDSFYAKAIAPLQDEAAKDIAVRKLLARRRRPAQRRHNGVRRQAIRGCPRRKCSRRGDQTNRGQRVLRQSVRRHDDAALQPARAMAKVWLRRPIVRAGRLHQPRL